MHLRVSHSLLVLLFALALSVSPAHSQDMSPGEATSPTDTPQSRDAAPQSGENQTPGEGSSVITQPSTETNQQPGASTQPPPTCSAAQTQAPGTAVLGRPIPLVPTPGPTNTVVPFFCKPFPGQFPLVNFFDHDLPFEFVDNNGYLLTAWGFKVGGVDGHSGYDWPMPEGTPILATGNGVVVFAASTPPFLCPPLNRETVGNVIAIEHQVARGNETLRVRSAYYHLSRIDVQNGQQVNAGDQIGLSGNTGCSGGPHLHFQTDVFAKGRFIDIDPYGWEGPGSDPWANDPRGTSSVWLWQDGQAPALYQDRQQSPNTPAGNAQVAPTFIRWLAISQDPNSQFVELTLDPRYAPSGTFDLSKATLRNNQGDTFTFPDGFAIHQGVTVRVYAGSGQNSASELYWGRSNGIFDPTGDCVYFQAAGWRGPYRLGLGKVCP